MKDEWEETLLTWVELILFNKFLPTDEILLEVLYKAFNNYYQTTIKITTSHPCIFPVQVCTNCLNLKDSDPDGYFNPRTSSCGKCFYWNSKDFHLTYEQKRVVDIAAGIYYFYSEKLNVPMGNLNEHLSILYRKRTNC